jgi:DMSO/TMAO reductase YedYZ molybdopterin-dependent catalytic subunit
MDQRRRRAGRSGSAFEEGSASTRPEDANAGTPIGRRLVLGGLGLAVAGTLFGEVAANAIGQALRPVAQAGGSGLADLLPGAERFQLYTVTGSYPDIPADRWRLAVGGLVKRPYELTFSELQALPSRAMTKTFVCVTGWQVPGVHWVGVPLEDLVRRAGPLGEGKALRFTSYDGVYTESLTLDQAARPDIIVAYEMLGGPITRDHGGPVRLYVPPMYGYKSIKWLRSIEVTDRVEPGYWEHYGYSVNAWIGRSNGI